MGPARHEQVAEPNLMKAYTEEGRADSLGAPSQCAGWAAACSSSEEHFTALAIVSSQVAGEKGQPWGRQLPKGSHRPCLAPDLKADL